MGDLGGRWQCERVVPNRSCSPSRSSSPDASVALVAIPSPEGWGFVQIGEPMSVSAEQPGALVLTVPIGVAAESGSVVVRLSDGTTRRAPTSPAEWSSRSSGGGLVSA